MAVILKKKAPIVVTIPLNTGADKQPYFCADEEPSDSSLIDILDDTTLAIEDTQGESEVTTKGSITSTTNFTPHGISDDLKNAGAVGMVVAKTKRVPNARQVEYGGETYASLGKCLKALKLCPNRFKYLKKTRKELRSDKAIIGIMVHERRADAQQGTSYVIAIKGEVCFESNLTAACTRVNQLLQLPPLKALTQGKVSKHRYEWNKRACNRDRQITLYEAFTSCLARLLVQNQLLDDNDKAIFKARMSVVNTELNNEDDLFEVVDDDNSHLEALSDLVEQYRAL